jgi:hypothetical protein
MVGSSGYNPFVNLGVCHFEELWRMQVEEVEQTFSSVLLEKEL